MSTTKKYEKELEELTSRVDAASGASEPDGVRDALQEKLSEAKAAFARLKVYGEDAIQDLRERGDETWSEFKDKLQDARDFIGSRLEGHDENEQ